MKPAKIRPDDDQRIIRAMARVLRREPKAVKLLGKTAKAMKGKRSR